MLVHYGFIDIYGIQWDDRQVNRYNDLQKRIQAFEASAVTSTWRARDGKP
jgi:hypothetical protein